MFLASFQQPNTSHVRSSPRPPFRPSFSGSSSFWITRGTSPAGSDETVGGIPENFGGRWHTVCIAMATAERRAAHFAARRRGTRVEPVGLRDAYHPPNPPGIGRTFKSRGKPRCRRWAFHTFGRRMEARGDAKPRTSRCEARFGPVGNGYGRGYFSSVKG